MKNFPDWVVRDIVENQLPWDEAQAVSSPAFFALHSLNNSQLFGLWLQPNRRTVAVIEWDLAVARSETPDYFSADGQGDWFAPMLLIIDFGSLLHQVNLLPVGQSNATLVIGQTNSSQLSLDAQEEIYNSLVQHPLLPEKSIDYSLSNDLCHSIFYGSDKASEVHLFHHEQMRVLCVNSAGTFLHIPSLGE